MSTIYLVRHGAYDNPHNITPGRLPVELSDEGREQLAKVRDFFADKNITTIYSSPVLRCKQSAEIISNGTIPVTYDVRLAETLTVAQGAPFRGVWIRPFYENVDTLGGESPKDVQNRMVDFWNSLDFASGKNYVICSHGDPLHLFHQYLLHDPNLFDDLDRNDYPNYLPKGGIRPIIATSNTEYTVQPVIKL